MPPETRAFGFFDWTLFALDIGCVLLTVWAVAIKVARRADWEARDWVAVAAAGFMALYLEKALGAFDTGHLFQVFVAGLPLVLLWSWRLLDRLGRLLAAWWRGWGARPAWLAHPVAAVLVPVIALSLVYAGAGPRGGRAAPPRRGHRVEHRPGGLCGPGGDRRRPAARSRHRDPRLRR